MGYLEVEASRWAPEAVLSRQGSRCVMELQQGHAYSLCHFRVVQGPVFHRDLLLGHQAVVLGYGWRTAQGLSTTRAFYTARAYMRQVCWINASVQDPYAGVGVARGPQQGMLGAKPFVLGTAALQTYPAGITEGWYQHSGHQVIRRAGWAQV